MSHNFGMASRGDLLKFSTAVITERLFQGKPMNDKVWIVAACLNVIGFVSYNLLITTWLDTGKYMSGSAKVAVDDVLRFATLFMVCRLLSGGAYWQNSEASNAEWVKDCGIFLASIVVYDLVLDEAVKNRLARFSGATNAALNDGIKWMTIFSTINFLKGGEFNQEWLLTAGGFTSGLMIYDLLVERVVKNYVNSGKL